MSSAIKSSKHASIKRVFIANRGEIARRIALTAKRLGIETVAVRAQDHQIPDFLWGLIDDFVVVPVEDTALYLDAGQMIELALTSGCDAIHPGFGFLSENAVFAAAIGKAGLTWIGPSPAAIDAMASKARARTLAEKVGVPCLAGLGGIVLDGGDAAHEALRNFAARNGYPVLIKAAMGGGGKGMRIVERDADLLPSAEAAGREAQKAFGDPSLIVEKYLRGPRHVEVQVLGDSHGHIVVLGDRDCSLQRRHQKIMEEAPAPALHPQTRADLHEAARKLAESVGYASAGTVEFLLDGSAPATAPQQFYFLEMNTRLQVEHPVTEEVFGIDLVEWQFRVARGEALPKSWDLLQPLGHAVEVRIYAEDVGKGFLPAPGRISAFAPAMRPGLRWEVGLDMIDEVSPRFDPMIAKLIARGASREEAMARLREGLISTVLAGPPNNVSYLVALLSDPEFVARPVTTHTAEATREKFVALLNNQRESLQDTATLFARALETCGVAPGPHAAVVAPSAVATLTKKVFDGRDQGRPACDIITCQEFTARGSVGGVLVTTRVGRGVLLNAGPKPLPCAWAVAEAGAEVELHCFLGGHAFVTRRGGERRRQSSGSVAIDGAIRAPVPGRVVKLLVAEGEAVAVNATAVILESMKMEFEVKTSKAGVVAAIGVKVGEQVDADQLLMSWRD